MNSSNATGTVMESVNRVGLGYGIAIAVGILVLISTIILASYVCIRMNSRHQFNAGLRGNDSIVMPQTIADESGPAQWSIGGLEQATLDTYPKILYSDEESLPHRGDTSCSICLADYQNSEVLRVLPDCDHIFHAPCIDAWLRIHASCPICRTSPLPTPLTTPVSTPLSELIPLARNPLQTRYSSSQLNR